MPHKALVRRRPVAHATSALCPAAAVVAGAVGAGQGPDLDNAVSTPCDDAASGRQRERAAAVAMRLPDTLRQAAGSDVEAEGVTGCGERPEGCAIFRVKQPGFAAFAGVCERGWALPAQTSLTAKAGKLLRQRNAWSQTRIHAVQPCVTILARPTW